MNYFQSTRPLYQDGKGNVYRCQEAEMKHRDNDARKKEWQH